MFKAALLWLLGLAAIPLALALAYTVLPVPVTPLMLIRLAEGNPQGVGIHKQWTPLANISPLLPRAVLAAEDTRFCQHAGFDWKALNTAIDVWQDDPSFAAQSRRQKGGSTISQQTAKNVFLWPGRDILRKGLEFPLTFLIENLWGKTRILEVYLNVVEFGPGIYGVGAAAQTYFKTTPAKLTARQAAALAAILPSPRSWSPVKPGPFMQRRIGKIIARAPQLGNRLGSPTQPLLACIQP